MRADTSGDAAVTGLAPDDLLAAEARQASEGRLAAGLPLGAMETVPLDTALDRWPSAAWFRCHRDGSRLTVTETDLAGTLMSGDVDGSPPRRRLQIPAEARVAGAIYVSPDACLAIVGNGVVRPDGPLMRVLY